MAVLAVKNEVLRVEFDTAVGGADGTSVPDARFLNPDEVSDAYAAIRLDKVAAAPSSLDSSASSAEFKVVVAVPVGVAVGVAAFTVLVVVTEAKSSLPDEVRMPSAGAAAQN